ncbi:MAG: hypothetical protein R6V45_08540 [Oceanipulchritudo sp.]
MKRIITLITLAGITLPAFAQSEQVTTVDSSPAKAFYATEEWEKAFMGYYGVNPGIEPGVPEDTADYSTMQERLVKDVFDILVDKIIVCPSYNIRTRIPVR